MKKTLLSLLIYLGISQGPPDEWGTFKAAVKPTSTSLAWMKNLSKKDILAGGGGALGPISSVSHCSAQDEKYSLLFSTI
jgi:hypothetical protein